MSTQNRRKQSGAFSFGEFVWWMGVVEDRNDPEKLGRVRVRVFGYHTAEKGDIPTEKLFWAPLVLPTNSASMSGLGVSPTGILPGSHVMGFFADGHDCQVPIILGSFPGRPSTKNSRLGFSDPSDKYPEYDLNEQDTNRLSRAEKIETTIVKKRRDDEDKGVVTAFGITWDEKTTPYAAVYPYNHVRETESHHIEEFDDTKGAERYMLWHKSGTFKEIHPDGTQVGKIKGDRYEITYGSNFVDIQGECNITIRGNSNLKINGNANIEVDGSIKETIHGNYALNVDGDFDMQVGGHHYANSGTHEKRTAPRIDLN